MGKFWQWCILNTLYFFKTQSRGNNQWCHKNELHIMPKYNMCALEFVHFHYTDCSRSLIVFIQIWCLVSRLIMVSILRFWCCNKCFLFQTNEFQNELQYCILWSSNDTWFLHKIQTCNDSLFKPNTKLQSRPQKLISFYNQQKPKPSTQEKSLSPCFC